MGPWIVSHLREVGAEIVVTKPVDHPSNDLVGTVRGDGVDVWVKIDTYGETAENFDPPYDDYSGVWWNVMNGEERVGNDVTEWPVIGCVPGTPAALEPVSSDGSG